MNNQINKIISLGLTPIGFGSFCPERQGYSRSVDLTVESQKALGADPHLRCGDA